MKRKIDWLNHSLEFFVVLIGILIAFQLNKCSNNRSQTELIENHLSQIKIECQENKERIRLSINQIEEQLNNCDSLLALIKGAKNPSEIRNQSTKLLDLRNVDLTKNAYKVLVESGDIRYLDDYEIKRNIISLYEGFEKVEQINQSNQNLYDSHFYPYIKSNFDLVNWKEVTIKSKIEEELYYAQEFANTVSTYRFLLLAKKRIYKEKENKLKEYLEK